MALLKRYVSRSFGASRTLGRLFFHNLNLFGVFHSLFFHNDPQTMRGSKSVRERENILSQCAGIFCVSEFIKKKFLED